MMKAYYEQDGIMIYHGKAEVILPQLPMVDLLATDPPYGISAAARGTIGTSKKGAVKDYGKSDWDDRPPPAWLIDQAIQKARHAIVFGGNFLDLPASSCWLVWDKDRTGDFADCELAWTNLHKAVRKFRWRWNGMIQEYGGDDKEPRFHPTQKPLAVMTWAIQQAPDDCLTILDPFMGSGTTLRAAKDLGRKAIGIEQNERYCEVAAQRLKQGILDFSPRKTVPNSLSQGTLL